MHAGCMQLMSAVQEGQHAGQVSLTPQYRAAVLQPNATTMRAGLQEGEAQSHAEDAALQQEVAANRPPLASRNSQSNISSICKLTLLVCMLLRRAVHRTRQTLLPCDRRWLCCGRATRIWSGTSEPSRHSRAQTPSVMALACCGPTLKAAMAHSR